MNFFYIFFSKGFNTVLSSSVSYLYQKYLTYQDSLHNKLASRRSSHDLFKEIKFYDSCWLFFCIFKLLLEAA